MHYSKIRILWLKLQKSEKIKLISFIQKVQFQYQIKFQEQNLKVEIYMSQALPVINVKLDQFAHLQSMHTIKAWFWCDVGAVKIFIWSQITLDGSMTSQQMLKQCMKEKFKKQKIQWLLLNFQTKHSSKINFYNNNKKQRIFNYSIKNRKNDYVYCFLYIIIFYNNHIMQILETPETERPKRSLSYNDLKKKRLIRSSKSSKKINDGQYYFSTVKKRPASEVKSILSVIPKDEKLIQNYILQLKGVLGELRQKSEKKRTLTIRQNLTERHSIKNSIIISQNKDNGIWNKIIDPSSTKQLIKNLLFKNKNKSQRRLVKFTQIRDNFKKQKSLSQSKDKQKINNIKIKEIPSPIKKISQNNNKYQKQTNYQQNHQKINNSKPQKIKLQQLTSLQHYKMQQNPSKIQLKNKNINQIIENGKQNEQNLIKNKQLSINDISIININQSSIKNNQSMFSILENIDIKGNNQIPGSFLKLMDSRQFNYLCKQNKDNKRRLDMERIKRIFPKGFFDN